MQLQIDTSKAYGIVLEGGGAKGSYQIGAWKALKEAGVKIRGIAGTSVGALNGALICMDDLEWAENIWKNISYAQVMEQPHSFKTKNLSTDFKGIAEDAIRVVKDRGFDVTPLKNLIAESVDEEKILQSDKELFVTTSSINEMRPLVLDVKNLANGGIYDALLASAYFPVFKNEKLGGKRYMDGGILNNVPVDVLIERGYTDIIVIRIYGPGFDTEKILEIPENVSVGHIAPRQDLGGVLEFDKKRARKNMQLGYMDAKRYLYGLEGRSYYFDAPQSEAYYFDKMMSELALVCHYIAPELEAEERLRLEGYRTFTEQLFPALGDKLKLKEGWNYKDLYLAILEKWAKELRIQRMQIYTPDQVVQQIHARLRRSLAEGIQGKT